jgi:two-component sensor histidine kinase
LSEPPRILYIDDDEGLRLLVQRGLTRRGFEVDTAASGAEGVAKAGEAQYDLIAVDHYMPVQDGLDTLKQLMALPEPQSVVYVTGSEESKVAVGALKAGAIDYVVKTAGDHFFDLLASTFRQALTKSELKRAKEAAEEQLRASNERLEALLREVNHRVSNSLQLVSAFVHMQSSALPDEAAKAALRDTQRRIEAIGQVHRRLYTSNDVESVDMKDYLAALVAELEETWSTPLSPRKLILRSDEIRLKTDKAVPVGVIVSELVTNACKYAYAKDAAGEVRVGLVRDGDGHFRLSVEDDGCGMPDDGRVIGTGLGTKLIRAMAASLGAEVSVDPAHRGVRTELRAAR